MNILKNKKNILHNLLIVLFALFCSVAINAQSDEPVTQEVLEQKQQAIIIEHIVQDGDTLSGLTNQYFGDATLWPLNAEINPKKCPD